MRQIKVAILGVGSRGGDTYAQYQRKFPERMKIVALADPNPTVMGLIAKEFNVPAENCFSSAEQFLQQPKMADAVIIATQDRQHVPHAIPALEKGYDILLEKPISNNGRDIMLLLKKAQETHRVVVICHVLRYTPFYQKIKEIIDSGMIGDTVTLNAAENVGYWHQAHSFVRGNWRNSNIQSPMILQKSCHDMDVILWLMGKSCSRISSFGSLREFRPENAPAGSTDRCLNGCKCKEECPFDAEKIYITNIGTGVAQGNVLFPCKVLTPEPTIESVTEALKTGPYGRCVYHCDNNVVDHQTVSIEFEDGAAASFTMSGFTYGTYREITVMGTRGEVRGNMSTNMIAVTTFGKEPITYDINKLATDFEGHGGGDHRMMTEFFNRIDGQISHSLTLLNVSVQSHLMCLAAEESRLHGGKNISISEFAENL